MSGPSPGAEDATVLGARPIGPVARALTWPFVGVIWAYRFTLSPLIGGQCRFEPTCSRYALEAYRVHGPVRGSWLTAIRILRCNPFVRGGIDPVPPRCCASRGEPPTASD